MWDTTVPHMGLPSQLQSSRSCHRTAGDCLRAWVIIHTSHNRYVILAVVWCSRMRHCAAMKGKYPTWRRLNVCRDLILYLEPFLSESLELEFELLNQNELRVAVHDNL